MIGLVSAAALPIVSPLIVLSGIFVLKMDVYRVPLEDMWIYFKIDVKRNLVASVVYISLRVILSFMAVMEGQRIFPFLMHFYALTEKLAINSIRIFVEYAERIRFVATRQNIHFEWSHMSN